MKTSLKVALILATLASVVAAQDKTELARVDENVSSYLKSELPGWRYKPVEPFAPSTNVLVQNWSEPNRVVTVAIAIRKSVDDAKQEFRSYLQFKRDPETLTGYGDEAYAPERNGPQIVFRKGRFVVYISIVTFVENDTETTNILREFARLISSMELK